VVDLREEGDPAYDDEIDGDVTVTPPAALIEVLQETDNGLERTDTMVAHKTDGDTLSRVENPGEIIDNQATNQAIALTDVSPDDVDSYTDESWDGSTAIAGMPNPSESDDAPNALDASHLVHPTGGDARADKSNWKLPFRTGPDAAVNTRALVAAKAALEGARGGVEGISESDREGAMARINDLLIDAPDELFGSMSDEDDGMGENVLERIVNSLQSLGWNRTETAGAESSVDADDDGADGGTSPSTEDNSTTMSEKTETLVEDFGFNADNLPSEDTECFEQIYNRFVEDEADETEGGGETNMSENTEKVVFESEEAFEEKVAEIVANRKEQSEKESLASEIAANSNEYDDSEAVLEDYPTEAALNTKHKDVLGGQADFSASRGASPEPATNTEDADDLKIFGSDA